MLGRFVSFAQNGEDVILNRVLADIEVGSYIEVGANHPTIDSVSRSFYNRGWSGIAIEPSPVFASLFRDERPRDTVIEAAATSSTLANITLHLIADTGLSTVVDKISRVHADHGFAVTDVVVPTVRLDDAIRANGLAGADIHFLMIDTEGAEFQVLSSIDLAAIRPWILIIEATAPGTTTPTHDAWEHLVVDAGYVYCQFDGLSRYYVAQEKYSDLGAKLSYPVCIFDDFDTLWKLDMEARIKDLQGQLSNSENEKRETRLKLETITASLAWKAIHPIRAIRRRFCSAGDGPDKTLR